MRTLGLSKFSAVAFHRSPRFRSPFRAILPTPSGGLLLRLWWWIVGEGGYRACLCISRVLQLSFCYSQGQLRVVSGDRSLTPQPFSIWRWRIRLSQGVSLRLVSPDLDFWSDASDVGWGAHLGPLVTSGLWEESESRLPINARELLAVSRGLLHFQSSLLGKTVAVYCDNVTVVAYLRKAGGTRSPFLNSIAQGILRWSKSLTIRLALQFILSSNNVLADALSRPHQLLHSEWSLNMTVFQSLSRQWPVQIDLFATSANHRCSTYFSPYRDPQSAGTDAFLQSWDGLQAHAFPPFFIIPRVLAKLRESRGTELLQLSLAPPVVLPDRLDLLLLPRSRLRYPDLHRLRLHAWRRCFTRATGFSSEVAAQASLARCPSSRANYQLKWAVYRSWCHSHGHSVSRLTLSKVADFLCWLRSARGLSVSSIRGYRSMLSAVFRFHLPSLSSDPVLRDLLRSFKLSSAERLLRPSAWNLSVVLRFLNSSAFEPLSRAPLRAL